MKTVSKDVMQSIYQKIKTPYKYSSKNNLNYYNIMQEKCQVLQNDALFKPKNTCYNIDRLFSL